MSESFVDTIKRLSKNLMDLDDEREVVLERDVVRAYSVLNFVKYESVADVFLGCAAVNLLNAYVKQGDAKIGYTFKSHLGAILNAIDQIGSFLIKVGYDNADNMHLLQIDICGFQFSYKSIEKTGLVDEMAGKIPWDKIRKQCHAQTIFNYAVASPWLTNETLDGDALRTLVEDDAKDFDEGAFVFRSGRLFKILRLEHRKKTHTALANYLREELRQARGELVLLEANFVKVWPLHITFTSVRPHISAVNSVVICDHINLLRKTVENYVDINSLVRGQTYFIVGYCVTYISGGDERMGVNIATDLNHCPILPATQFNEISNDTLSRLYRFGIKEFMASKQRELLYR